MIHPYVTTRPGTATAAAVLAFTQAAITLSVAIGLLFVLVGAPSTLAGTDLTLGWLVTLVQAVGGGLLIYGGVRVLGGTGRTSHLVASALQVLLCVYYLVRIASYHANDPLPGTLEGKSAATTVPLLFAVMPVVGAGLILLSPAAAAWTRPAARQ